MNYTEVGRHIEGEIVADGDGSCTRFSSLPMCFVPIKPNSFIIKGLSAVDGLTLEGKDDGHGNIKGDITGTLDYNLGELEFETKYPVEIDTNVTCTYYWDKSVTNDKECGYA